MTRSDLREKLGREPTPEEIMVAQLAESEASKVKEFTQVSGCPERNLGPMAKVAIGVVALGAATAAAYAGGLFDFLSGDKDGKKKTDEKTPSQPPEKASPKGRPQAPPAPRAQGAPVNLPTQKNPLAGLLSIAGPTVEKALSLAELPIAGAGDEQTTQTSTSETPDHVFLFPEAPPTGGPPPFVPQPTPPAPSPPAKHAPAKNAVKAPDVQNPRAGHDDAATHADPLAALLAPVVQQLTTLGKKVDALAAQKTPPPAPKPAARPPAKSASAPLLSLLGGAVNDIGLSGTGAAEDEPEAGA